MTPTEVKEYFEAIIDDVPDEDITFGLMDTAYTMVNEERPWAMLLKLDSSITHSPGNTWETEKTLPSDFGRPYKLFGGASNNNEYDPIPFERILEFVNSTRKYAIDLVNSKMRLIGAPSSALTMYLWYLYVPTSLFGLSDVQKAASSTIVWPARFHRVLAYRMAESLFGGIDSDELAHVMTPQQRKDYTDLKRAMISWDNSIKLKMMDTSSASVARARGSYPDVVDYP